MYVHPHDKQTKDGLITSIQAIYVPADDLTDPAPQKNREFILYPYPKGKEEKGKAFYQRLKHASSCCNCCSPSPAQHAPTCYFEYQPFPIRSSSSLVLGVNDGLEHSMRWWGRGGGTCAKKNIRVHAQVRGL